MEVDEHMERGADVALTGATIYERAKMTAKKNVADVATKVYNLLEPLEPEDRQRAIAAALTLLGAPTTAASLGSMPALGGPGSGMMIAAGTAAAFFSHKQPNSKIEELAVAARHREAQGANMHTKDELHQVFKDARRNFDTKNFKRDLNNAKLKGLFTRGKDITLAYYGQQYVDALPDREAVKALKSPKRAKRGAGKKRTSKG